MHQHLTPSTTIQPTVQPIESVAARLAREQAEDDAWEAARDAEIAGKYRGREYARTCLACPHLPPDYLDVGTDPLSLCLREARRIDRLEVHAREGCDVQKAKDFYGRVLGLDDWGDGAEEDLIRRVRFEAWEARHASR